MEVNGKEFPQLPKEANSYLRLWIVVEQIEKGYAYSSILDIAQAWHRRKRGVR